jgi:hypothetical protein
LAFIRAAMPSAISAIRITRPAAIGRRPLPSIGRRRSGGGVDPGASEGWRISAERAIAGARDQNW